MITDELFSIHGLSIALMLKKLRSIPYIIFGTNAVSPESHVADLAMSEYFKNKLILCGLLYI